MGRPALPGESKEYNSFSAFPTTLTTLDVSDGDIDQFGMAGVTLSFVNPSDATSFEIVENAPGSYSLNMVATVSIINL